MLTCWSGCRASVADLVKRLEESILRFLEKPLTGHGDRKNEDEVEAVLSPIRQPVTAAMHDLSRTRIADCISPTGLVPRPRSRPRRPGRSADDHSAIGRIFGVLQEPLIRYADAYFLEERYRGVSSR
jgi:hypothetical protein